MAVHGLMGPSAQVKRCRFLLLMGQDFIPSLNLNFSSFFSALVDKLKDDKQVSRMVQTGEVDKRFIIPSKVTPNDQNQASETLLFAPALLAKCVPKMKAPYFWP
jgi:hypothetical protein